MAKIVKAIRNWVEYAVEGLEYDELTATLVKAWTGTTAGVVSPSTLASALVRIASNSNWTKTQIWTGTQSQYDALGTYDSNCLYFTVESSSSSSSTPGLSLADDDEESRSTDV